ncbi:hypothetical protein JTB14_020678 [Gonioctena quinquepunctata]|nr:hypothetical protein JTB14_020678 [Gonioctena quinquepunctata]
MNNSNATAFDYESSENNTVSQPNMPNTTNHQTPAAAGQSSSYVSVAKSLPKPTFPKKSQTIVLHAEDRLKLFDYAKAIGDIIGAKHITSASKISNNGICIYLSCPNDVDELLKTNPTAEHTADKCELPCEWKQEPTGIAIFCRGSPSWMSQILSIFDCQKSGLRFLVDSGADVSSLPARKNRDKVISDFKLFTANGTEIPTFDECVMNVDL